MNQATAVATTEADETKLAAVEEFKSLVIQQAHAFEEGLFDVSAEAMRGGYQPISVALASARNVCKIGMTIAAIKGLDKAEWEEMVRDMFNSTVSDIIDNFDEIIATITEGVKG